MTAPTIGSTKTPVSRTYIAALPDRMQLSATASLVPSSRDGGRAHFSLTGELRNLRRRGDDQIEACGQLTKSVLAWFPALAPVAAVHLSDDHGIPMFAVANGAYWLGLGDPRYRPADAPRFDYFASLWRVTDAVARAIYTSVAGELDPVETLRRCADAMLRSWAADADVAYAIIAG